MPDTYNPDELILNDGADFTNGVYYPAETVEEKEAEAKAAGIIAASYPVIKDVDEWFEAAIDECDSVKNIEMTTMTYGGVKYERKIHVEAQVLAYQLLADLLADKRKEFGLQFVEEA